MALIVKFLSTTSYILRLLYMDHGVILNNISKHTNKITKYSRRSNENQNTILGFRIKHLKSSTYTSEEDLRLQATTAKQREEKLTQKVEQLDEVPLVPVVTKDTNKEGFNDTLKNLGTAVTKAPLKYNFNNEFYDELAKRCLFYSMIDSDIDKCILKRIKSMVVRSRINNDSPGEGKTKHSYSQVEAKETFVKTINDEISCIGNTYEDPLRMPKKLDIVQPKFGEQSELSLTEMLKKVRERNRSQKNPCGSKGKSP